MSSDLSPRTSTAKDRQEAILEALRARDGRASVPLLIEQTGLPQPTLYRWINRLKERGLVSLEGGFVTLRTGENRGEKAGENRPVSTEKSEIGENFLTNSQAFSPHSQSPIPPSISSVGSVVQNVTGEKLGIPQATIDELGAVHGSEAVQYQLRHLDLAKRFGPKPITHPVAWIKAALDRRWEPAPELLAAAKAAEATRVLEASQEAARASRRRTIEVDAKAQDRLAALSEEERDALVAQAVVTDLPPCLARLLAKAILIDQTP